MPPTLALHVVKAEDRWEARVKGDSTLRLLVAARTGDVMTARLCAHLVTRSIAPTAIPFTLPINKTMPPLAIRLIESPTAIVKIPGSAARVTVRVLPV